METIAFQSTSAAPKIVIWNTWAEDNLAGELLKHLSMLRREGVTVKIFLRDMQAGTSQQAGIEELVQADLRLLLISPEFLQETLDDPLMVAASNAVLARKMSLEKANLFHGIIPIIVRPIEARAYSLDPLIKGIQALPKDAKPVVSWSDRDDAWKSATIGLRQTLIMMGKLEQPEMGRRVL